MATPAISVMVRYERADGTVLTREVRTIRNIYDRAPMATFKEKARKSASAAVNAVLGYKEVVKEK